MQLTESQRGDVMEGANRKIDLWSDASSRRLTIDIIGFECNSRGWDRAGSEFDAFAVDTVATRRIYDIWNIAYLSGTYVSPKQTYI